MVFGAEPPSARRPPCRRRGQSQPSRRAPRSSPGACRTPRRRVMLDDLGQYRQRDLTVVPRAEIEAGRRVDEVCPVGAELRQDRSTRGACWRRGRRSRPPRRGPSGSLPRRSVPGSRRQPRATSAPPVRSRGAGRAALRGSAPSEIALLLRRDHPHDAVLERRGERASASATGVSPTTTTVRARTNGSTYTSTAPFDPQLMGTTIPSAMTSAPAASPSGAGSRPGGPARSQGRRVPAPGRSRESRRRRRTLPCTRPRRPARDRPGAPKRAHDEKRPLPPRTPHRHAGASATRSKNSSMPVTSLLSFPAAADYSADTLSFTLANACAISFCACASSTRPPTAATGPRAIGLAAPLQHRRAVAAVDEVGAGRQVHGAAEPAAGRSSCRCAAPAASGTQLDLHLELAAHRTDADLHDGVEVRRSPAP